MPNFWLNRNWAWQRRGRPSLRQEVLPYVGIILTTVLLATLLTHLADVWLHHQGVSSTVRVTLVAGVFLGTYIGVFALRFLLLDRLFRRPATCVRLRRLPGGTGMTDDPAGDLTGSSADAFSAATGRSLEDTSGVNQLRYRAFQL